MLAAATVGYLWAVASITLGDRPYGDEVAGVVARLVAWLAQRPATAWIGLDLVEFAANVAMFVPLGVLVVLWLGGRRWVWAPVVGLAVSGVIETVQLLFLDTRVADVRDLVSNTLGATIGALLTVASATLWARRPRRVVGAPGPHPAVSETPR